MTMNEKDIDSFPDYVLISAAKNEAPHIELTLQSVIAQELKPICWVIVNDGSMDTTESIISKYLRESGFIHLISNPPVINRDFGAKVKALKHALEYITKLNVAYKYIGNLDADISFNPDFYKCLIQHMENEPKLGITSGVNYENHDGKWVYAHSNPEWCAGGQTQFFRNHLFIDQGGYPILTYGGEDTVLEYIAREKGFIVQAMPDCIYYHHKPLTFSGTKGIQDFYNNGKQDFLWGSHFLYEICKCFSRSMKKPYFIAGFGRFAGYVTGWIEFKQPTVPPSIARIIKKQQLHRLLKIIPGMGNKRI